MRWELEWRDWSGFAPLGVDMGEVIYRLIHSEDEAEIERFYWQIDSVVVVNGALQPGATDVTACLVQGLLTANDVSRQHVLELLVQLGGGVDPLGSDRNLAPEVQREVLRGLPLYSEIMESGSRSERMHCMDLVSISVEIDKSLTGRARALIQQASAMGEDERRLAAAILAQFNES
ncbi:hypothetical protein [Nonomuraea sp. NPDC049684]|uniref:hypothetical protein n=1 Tax=Nonomuraea sp. NPDC049684 TaxID=3364356 RepID=UPI0037A74095